MTEEKDKNAVVVGDENPNTDVEPEIDKVENELEPEPEPEPDEGVDPYEAELRRLDGERKKAEDIARQKGGALEEERTLRKQAEAELKALKAKPQSEEVDKKIAEAEARIRASIQTEQQINALTSNPKERELIRKIMEEKSLSVEDAFILANKHVVVRNRSEEDESFQEQAALAAISGLSAGGVTKRTSPFRASVESGLTEAERKNLDPDDIV